VTYRFHNCDRIAARYEAQFWADECVGGEGELHFGPV